MTSELDEKIKTAENLTTRWAVGAYIRFPEHEPEPQKRTGQEIKMKRDYPYLCPCGKRCKEGMCRACFALSAEARKIKWRMP
jgi:hypothetical protein